MNTNGESTRVREPSADMPRSSWGHDSRGRSDHVRSRPGTLKLDHRGLPLVPQPSRFMDDPLNWPPALKWAVLIQVGIMAFLGPYNSALINPSLVLLSESLEISVMETSYTTTTAILAGGVSPFIWTPLSNLYGRRPITLIAMLVTIMGGVGSALSGNYAALMGTRALCGLGFGGMMSVGTACVADLFFLHERGEKIGVYSIFVTNGAHAAALVGGFLGQAQGWEWDYYLGAITTAFSFVVALFLLPETLFPRNAEFLDARYHERTYRDLLWNFRGNMIPGRSLQTSDFLQSFTMLKYPSLLFPFWYYMWSWTFVNILPAITLANLYTQFYHLQSGTIGVCLGVSLTIGSVLGECTAGRLSDYIVFKLAKRNKDHIRKPEYRLYLTYLGAIFMPAGLIEFGATVGKYHYTIPLIGLAIGSFGLQITSTCLYTYVSDAYKSQTPESGVLFNLSRGLSFVVGFFALPLANKTIEFLAISSQTQSRLTTTTTIN
ncbi:hypothetical protein B7494_g6488 [Chlorociboria aeruginascens]|nr:hypothetical protein B7494_g6488 [Chlorociboria aeruginascens]